MGVGDGAGDGAVPADKAVLRLAAELLGLRGVARERKRAIQFGTRLAAEMGRALEGSARKASAGTRVVARDVAGAEPP